MGRYSSILPIRDIKEPSKRGYAFEDAIREILPWDYRPPIAVSAPSESAQFDAVFVWNSWHFIVESKAVGHKITAGSAEWEDFELKVRQRQKGSLGLFCSLFDVADNVRERAKWLNREGAFTFILADQFWDELAEGDLEFSDVLHYMVFYSRTTFVAVPPALSIISAWKNDKDTIHRTSVEACHHFSAIFLRRHQLRHHARTYVERGIDQTLSQVAASLQPSRLASIERKRQRTVDEAPLEFVTSRSRPAQVVIFRDASGSGKTTTAVQIGLTTDPFLGAVTAAIEPGIDEFDETLLGRLSAGKGLSALCTLDKPIILAIDSLDEAYAVPHKQTQVISVLRLLDELNAFAFDKRGLLAFPLALMFTVRDDYWRQWQSAFEGREIVDVRTKYSMFTPSELDRALERYPAAYSYRLLTAPGDDARYVLSLPFYMQVFSEANAKRDGVSTAEVLGENVLRTYFATKRESLLKRFIPGLTPSLAMRVLGALAAAISKREDLRIAWRDATAAIVETAALLQGYEHDLLKAIVSDEILVREGDESGPLRFRHLQFVEYLMAHRIVTAIAAGDDEALGRATDEILRLPLLSPHRVHTFIRFLAESEHPETKARIEAFYSTAPALVESVLPLLRRQIANGERTEANDLHLVLKVAGSPGARSSWDAFFILVASANRQDAKTLATAFENAWVHNAGRADRWKLIAKMVQRGLAFEDSVVRSLLGSKEPREWEAFLGGVLDTQQRAEFKAMWVETMGVTQTVHAEGLAWQQANHILRIVLHDLAYVPGEFAGTEPQAKEAERPARPIPRDAPTAGKPSRKRKSRNPVAGLALPSATVDAPRDAAGAISPARGPDAERDYRVDAEVRQPMIRRLLDWVVPRRSRRPR